jgi:hypothetical protein
VVAVSLVLALPPLDTEDEVVIDMRTDLNPPPTAKALPTENDVVPAASESDSNRGTSSFEGYDYSLSYRIYSFVDREHFSRSTSPSRASTQTLLMPILDLERRLVTDRTLDIFTMTSKVDGSLYGINDS